MIEAGSEVTQHLLAAKLMQEQQHSPQPPEMTAAKAARAEVPMPRCESGDAVRSEDAHPSFNTKMSLHGHHQQSTSHAWTTRTWLLQNAVEQVGQAGEGLKTTCQSAEGHFGDEPPATAFGWCGPRSTR